MYTVAVLDYAKYAHGTVVERLDFAQSLIKSLEKYGFVKLKNHGIPEEQVQQLFQMIDHFFNLPLETRQSLEMKHEPSPQRGYQSFGVEKTAWLRDLHPDVEHFALKEEEEEREKLGDEKEFFSIGPADDTQYTNVWPQESDIPGFRNFMETMFESTRTIGLHLVEAIALGLNVPASALLNRCLPDSSYARLISYPEAPVERLKSGKSQRIWPHTDEGVLTLLFQDGVGGLELEDRPNGRHFVPVTPTPAGAPSEIVVNTSDALQRWTNDAIKAGLHQVNVPANLTSTDKGVVPKRFSYPFFLGPNFDASIGPLPQFVTETCPAKYGEMKYLDYCKMLVGGNYVNRSSAEGEAKERAVL